MKGLAEIPKTQDLRRAWDVLQGAKSLVDVRQLALYSQWARLDPHLAEIWVGHLSKYWRDLPLGRLLDELREWPWPRAVLVLLRFTELAVAPKDRSTIKLYLEVLEERFPVPQESRLPELFFIPLSMPNPVVLRNEVERRSKPYTKAGYIGSQSLLSRGRSPKERTLLAPDRRRKILEDLFRRQDQVKVSDYIAACGGMVSRRQAQRDLDSFGGASSRGFTRGRKYLRRNQPDQCDKGRSARSR